MNKNDREYLVQKIRSQYIEKENTDLDALKALDAKVKRPANIFAYAFGSVGAIVMGTGMSLIMTDIAEKIGINAHTMASGVIIGVVGMSMAILNYPIYKRILQSRRREYAQSIIDLSDQMMKN